MSFEAEDHPFPCQGLKVPRPPRIVLPSSLRVTTLPQSHTTSAFKEGALLPPNPPLHQN